MKTRSLIFKTLGFALCLSMTVYATEFELKNESSIPLKAIFGPAYDLRISRANFIVPGETFRASISSQDEPRLFIVNPSADYHGETFKFDTTADEVKLKIVNSYSGKVALEPQAGSITKHEIIRVSSGSITGSLLYNPSEEPSKPGPQPAQQSQQLVLVPQGGQQYAPPPNAATSRVTPYMLLGIPSNADDSKILGVDHATLKVAMLGTASAKNTVKKAFLKHSLVWHPDKIDSAKAQAAFKKAGVTDPEEQRRLANDVFILLLNTYEKYK